MGIWGYIQTMADEMDDQFGLSENICVACE